MLPVLCINLLIFKHAVDEACKECDLCCLQWLVASAQVGNQVGHSFQCERQSLCTCIR